MMTEIKTQRRLDFIFLPLCILMSAWFLYFTMLRNCNPPDYSGFIDAAWRVYRGQRIYRDFFFHAGPVWPYTLAFFIAILGFGIKSIFAHLCCINSGAILVTYLMVRKRIHPLLTVLCTLSVAAGFYWNYPFPHYTHDATWWGMPGLLVLFAQTPFRGSRRAFVCGAICGILFMISYMTKFVVGLPYGIVFLSVLLISGFCRAAFLGFLVGALGTLAVIGWMIGGFAHYQYDMGVYSKTVTERVGRFLNPLSYLYNFYWLVVTILIVNLFPFLKKFRRELVFFIGTAFIAIFALITGSVGMLTNNSLLGICLGFGFMLLEKIGKFEITETGKKLRKLSYGGLVLIAVFQIGYTATLKTAVALQKWKGSPKALPLFDWSENHSYVMKNPALKGWHCQPEFGTAVDYLVFYINRNISPEDSILCLSPWEIVYAAAGRDSYKNVTFQILPGAIPVPGEHLDTIRNNIIKNPPDWIITYVTPYLPTPVLNKYVAHLRLNRFIVKNYSFKKTFGNLLIAHRKAPKDLSDKTPANRPQGIP